MGTGKKKNIYIYVSTFYEESDITFPLKQSVFKKRSFTNRAVDCIIGLI